MAVPKLRYKRCDAAEPSDRAEHIRPVVETENSGAADQQIVAELDVLCEALEALCQGDTSHRLSETSLSPVYTRLHGQINRLSENMQEIIDNSHEMAIGLCEHYETLLRISRGDFSARAAEDSKNELIAKLGTLVNMEASTLTGVIERLKVAEDKAKSAYQQVLDIVEFLPDATFVIDSDKKVIAWNRAIEELTGVPKSEVLGLGDYAYAIPFYGEKRPILIDMLDEDVDVIDRKYLYIKRHGRTLFAEARIPQIMNRGMHYLWATASPLFDRNGNRVGGIESVRDITDYKHAEEEKSRLETQLNHSRLMESFMIQLGHDLKTPLTPLFAVLPLLRERMSDPELKLMADICCRNVEKIKDLTEKTLKLVQLSSPVARSSKQRVNLANFLAALIHDNADLRRRRDVSCQLDIDDILVNVIPEQFKELIDNLFSNALRYSPEQSCIHISAEALHQMVVLKFRDEGEGIEAQHVENIFDEFYKADESRHDLGTSGLGLSICKRIMLNHHGSIHAESPGKGFGATFVITLPLEDQLT